MLLLLLVVVVVVVGKNEQHLNKRANKFCTLTIEILKPASTVYAAHPKTQTSTKDIGSHGGLPNTRAACCGHTEDSAGSRTTRGETKLKKFVLSII
jgi:hypothetical protein